MIRVLIVDDSPVAQDLIAHILSADPQVEIIGRAANGLEAMTFLESRKPDVITMDIHMPKLDGFEATRQIMEKNPVPIIIVTASWDPQEVSKTFRAMQAGAIAAIEKPRGIGHPDYGKTAAKLLETVKLMSEVKVVKRWPNSKIATSREENRVGNVQASLPGGRIQLVAIGASTGGPPVLQSILSVLPKSFPIPILIVQHIAAGFLQGLVDWLNQTTPLSVSIARDADLPLPGHAYLAPDGCQTGLDKSGRIRCLADPAENGLRPAVSYLFRSVAAMAGKEAIGVLLTGMGKDGAEELKLLQERGALTIAQDRQSSVVFGMPGEAVRIGAASHVLPPERIGALLNVIANKIPG
jgi:two-component system chemotaxis response regulator CheB